MEPIPLAYVVHIWRAGTINRVVVKARQAGNRFLGSLKGLQIRALVVFADEEKQLEQKRHQQGGFLKVIHSRKVREYFLDGILKLLRRPRIDSKESIHQPM